MKKILCCTIVAVLLLTLVGCNFDNNPFVNPGDYLGGGGTSNYTPTETQNTLPETVTDIIDNVDEGETEVPTQSTEITDGITIEQSGEYNVSGELAGKINVKAENVTIYLDNATLTNGKKVIESKYDLTITLIGENSITNSTADANTITCDGTLTVNGTGSLTINSTKNGISANSINVVDATLDITALKDGLHAEIDKYDGNSETPTFSYEDGGFVYLSNATVNIVSANDGIQADTFVYVVDSNVDIVTNGGAPTNITETSSDNGQGKGIKVGTIDWSWTDEDGVEQEGELEKADYLLYVESGNLTLNTDDDALHSDGNMVIAGGTINIQSGDDGLHANELLQIAGGTINVSKCYEGVEGAKVEISGGEVTVNATDDGINAADGTATQVNNANNNCHIIISGGTVTVKANGDGLDSNGSLLISGGTVHVSGSSSGADASLDADGSIIVNGGNLFATGALGMVETPATNSAQYCVSFAQSTNITAGTILYLVDSNGNELMSHTVQNACQSVILSCAELTKGSTYYIYGGSTQLCSFTVQSIITQVGTSSSSQNPGGRPGGFGGR